MGDVSWRENVGKIRFIDNDKCAWIVPYPMLLNPKSSVTSPMFSLRGYTWQLAKIQHMLCLSNEDDSSLDSEYNVALSVMPWLSGKIYWSCRGQTKNKEGYDVRLFKEGTTTFSNNTTLTFYEKDFGYIKIVCQVNETEVWKTYEHPSCKQTNTIHSSSISEEKEETKDKVKGLERLAMNLRNLLMDGQNSDVILKAGDREFPVHRGILGARSPVFASMFQLEMKEKTSGVVDIPDCMPESFKVFLLYLYTGTAETISSENVSNLYYAADKYRVDDLKAECVQFMKNNMSAGNFCDIVTLALKHNEPELLKEALQLQDIQENHHGC